MPDDTTEGVTNIALGCNHQSICMPQLQPLCSAALVPIHVLPQRESLWGSSTQAFIPLRDEGLGKPGAVIKAS